jgi:hypothetical protein
MKVSYVTLVSMVVAYSAYQGSGLSKAGSSSSLQAESKVARDSSMRTDAIQQGKTQDADLFPTINAGVCRLTVDGGRRAPCGDCKTICPAKELNALIGDHFRAEAGSDQKYLAAHWAVPQSAQEHIRFVLASLPDPVHTHMALLFDRGIESIQGAAQASGYLFSRAWMPWDIASHSEPSDFTVRMAQAKFRASVESLPGLMIFERNGSNSGTEAEILFVFVVGETPTGGIRIEQFQSALNIRHSILADSKADLDESKILRIYGPEFSGSLASLNAILKAQRPRDQLKHILIRSGTVSSYHAVHDFCVATHREWREAGSDDGTNKMTPDPGVPPDFATFQFSDAYEEYYLSVFFKDRHREHSHIAILSEDETAFGNQEKKEGREDQEKSADTLDSCQVEPPQPVVKFLRLYFPREIAQLRDAYQRNVKVQSVPEAGKNQPQSGLALSLSVTGNDDDSVALYSPLQMPLSQESILQAIVASLRKEHAKVVVIRGADPLDVVFLSRYLRQNYPQARLVTTGLDLLMIHDLYDPRFHGILGIAPFPLLNGAEFPRLSSSGEDKVYRLFPDSYSVGSFNAFQSLLALNATTQAADRLPGANYAQFGLPSFLQPKDTDTPWRAHLWLAAVGRDGYWPVAMIDELHPSRERDMVKTQSIRTVNADSKIIVPYSVHFSLGWTILWIPAFGLTVFLAFLLAFPHTITRSEILGRFGGVPSPERNFILFAGTIFVLIAQTLFVFPTIIWLNSFHSAELLNGMWLVSGCYIISILALGCACLKGFWMRGNVSLALAGLVVSVTAVVMTLSLTVWMASQTVSSQLGAFTYRYIHVGSGVSPLLPLLFLMAAWIWWCWQTLTGITSTQEKHMVLPAASNFDQNFAAGEGSGKLVEEASDRLRLKAIAAKDDEWPWVTLGIAPVGTRMNVLLPAGVGLAIIFLLMRPSEIAEAFEFSTYKGLYWFLLYSCLLLVCYLVTHIVVLWGEFRILLRAIDRLPFRRGFSDLKNLTWKPLWKLAGNGRQEFVRLLGSEMDALLQIQNCNIPNPGLTAAVKDAKTLAGEVSDEYEKMIEGKGDRETPGEVQKKFHDLQEKLAYLTSQALVYVNRQWKNELYAPPIVELQSTKDSDGKQQAVEPPADDRNTRTVEHFLCLFYLNIILVPLRRLQTLILAIAGVFVFVLISYSSYPFESRESFHVLLISIFFAISLVVGIVYGQMYSNPLLGRITNTTPGELGLDFWVRLGSFVFIPLLSLVSVQFPEVNNFLFSWLEPALQSIK